MASPLSSSSLSARSHVLFFLIPQDLTSSSKTFFPPLRSLLLVYTLSRHVYAARIVGRNPRDEQTSVFDRISHFPRGCREIGRGSLPITHCPLQLKLPDRTRASVGYPPVDSTFLWRAMLICSLFLLFVRGNRRLRNRYQTGPYPAERDTNFVRFLDKQRKDINTKVTEPVKMMGFRYFFLNYIFYNTSCWYSFSSALICTFIFRFR